MLCCLFIALLGGPFLLWASPRASIVRKQDCCAENGRLRLMAGTAALVLVILVVAMFLPVWPQLAPFRHICSLLASQ